MACVDPPYNATALQRHGYSQWTYFRGFSVDENFIGWNGLNATHSSTDITNEIFSVSVKVACIDKWVNSKFEDATPPALCSGPKLAIWNKNQPPRPEKTPGHGEKSKMAILVLFGSRRSLGEKETDLYNDSCPTVFNLYDIHTPQTPARHP